MKLWPIIMFLALPLLAEDIYVSQEGDGTTNTLAWLNDAGNWGEGAGKVSAGDTVHLVGTLTNRLTIQGNGSAGSLITIYFEPGAKFSAPHWETGAAEAPTTSCIIDCNGKSYITIDGGTNGLLESTDNGGDLTYQKVQWGVMGYQATMTNFTLRNLTISNLYVHNEGNTAVGSAGVRVCGENIIVSNCVLSYCTVGIHYDPLAGTHSNVVFRSNTVYHSNWGLSVQGAQNNAYARDIFIQGNRVDYQYTSYDPANSNHRNGFCFWDDTTGSILTNLVIEGNYFGPNNARDHSTSDIQIGITTSTNQLVDLKIINNVIVHGPYQGATTNDDWSVNCINAARCSGNSIVANNTIIGGAKTGYGIAVSDGNPFVFNNLMTNVGISVYFYDGLPYTSDYGIWVFRGSATIYGPLGAYYSLADWQTASSFDANTTTNVPLLDATYVPLTNDTVARLAGTNLSAWFTTDYNGSTRTNSGAWTIGAFEIAAAAVAPLPPDPPQAAPAVNANTRNINCQTLIIR